MIDLDRRPWRTAHLLTLGLVLVGCGCARPEPPPATACPDPSAATRASLAARHPRYLAALDAALAWLDRLEVDPVDLQIRGYKGKKKLVEILDAYLRLHAVAAPHARPALHARIVALARHTARDAYHDMATVDDTVFEQNSTSYLRAALLLDRHGLDVGRYRREIVRIKARLDAHLPKRGAHQREAFRWYYAHFGLESPPPSGRPAPASTIEARRPLTDFRRRSTVYALTHDIFVPFEFGERLDVEPFDAEARAYLDRTLAAIAGNLLVRGDADLLAEIISCMRYLRLTDRPIYREALAALLDAQRPNGSWGDYERMRARHGDFVEQGWYLHTTAVAIDALTVAFHEGPLGTTRTGPSADATRP